MSEAERGPLALELGGLRLEAERFDGDAEAGWHLHRDAVIEVGGRRVAVRVQCCISEVENQGALPPADLDAMASAAVLRVEFLKGGSSLAFRLDLAGRLRVVFKPQQLGSHSEPRKEAAAHAVGLLLGGPVPATRLRRVHRDQLIGRLAPDARRLVPRIEAEVRFDEEGFSVGSVAQWIPIVVDSRLDTLARLRAWTGWLGDAELPDHAAPLMAQLSSLLVFDLLINNEDRFTGGNLLTSPDDRVLYWMDNGLSFGVDHDRAWSMFSRCRRFSRRTIAAVSELDRERLKAGVGDLLGEEEIAGVLARRDAALSRVAQLVAHHGERAVLCFE